MLDYFKVPEKDVVVVKPEILKETTKLMFMKCGVPEDEAELGADVLLHADLRGIETHGVSNLLRNYISWFNSGKTNPNPKWKIIRESPTTATIDGDAGLGLMITAHAMNLAIEKAEKYGTGSVSIRNSEHCGAVGYFAMMALEYDMVGTCMTAGGNTMVPTFGAEAKLGTNPIAIAVPTLNKPPFVFDAATTTIAGNKMGLLERIGANMQPGWVAHDDGTPDMDGGGEFQYAKGPQRMQLPLGSTRELGSHKGYGLGVSVDIMCGMLSNGFGFKTLDSSRRAHYVSAFRVDGFAEVSEFKESMDQMLEGLEKTKPAPGHERVLYAGLEEYEEELIRKKDGIPLHSEVVEWYRGACEEMKLEFNLA